MREAVQVSEDSPVLLDFFLNNAIEVDVDCVSDGQDVVIGGIMQHVEQAGIHSGDSGCSLPPYSLDEEIQDEIRRQTKAMAYALGVVGLMNVQFAVQDGVVFVLESEPTRQPYRTVRIQSHRCTARQSRRTRDGRHFAERARRRKRSHPGLLRRSKKPCSHSSNSRVWTPFSALKCALTGEVMGVGASFGEAYFKANSAQAKRLSTTGKVFLADATKQTAHRQNRTKLPSTRLRCLRHSRYRRILERTRHHRASGQQSAGRPPTHRGRN